MWLTILPNYSCTCPQWNYLLLPQRTSMKRASKAAVLNKVVGIFSNIHLALCIVVGVLDWPTMQCVEQPSTIQCAKNMCFVFLWTVKRIGTCAQYSCILWISSFKYITCIHAIAPQFMFHYRLAFSLACVYWG